MRPPDNLIARQICPELLSQPTVAGVAGGQHKHSPVTHASCARRVRNARYQFRLRMSALKINSRPSRTTWGHREIPWADLTATI